MAFDYPNQHLAGLTVFIYFGNTTTIGEDLTQSGSSSSSWFFANTPVSQRNLRLLGTTDSGTGFIMNFELEPITGLLTLPNDVSGVTANYNSFNNRAPILLTPGTFLPKSQRPVQRQDMHGQYHANIPNFYPASLNLEVVKTVPGEEIINPIAEQILNAYHFLLVDQSSEKAYEGPVLSDRHLSVGKGFEPFFPVEILVEEFGSFDPDTETIDWGAFKN